MCYKFERDEKLKWVYVTCRCQICIHKDKIKCPERGNEGALVHGYHPEYGDDCEGR
jgi:hypothetical protein